MPSDNECPPHCFQGSTQFYNSPDTDEYTPSYLDARPLQDNVATRSDGTIPPWMVAGSTKSPSLQYVEWFNGIWHTGDPSTWNATVFTNLAVMIDPTGISKGAKEAAASFLLLFKYYPELRGEVVSWAANDREIFINWRFSVKQRGSGTPLLVPVVDKFCFQDGRVSFRLANFDIISLTGYLSENYGQGQLTDFLWASFWQAQKSGGILLLPRMIWNLVQGLFYWSTPSPSSGLTATPGAGVVNLEWSEVPEAVSYTINRATALSGPYEPPSPDGQPVLVDAPTLSYEDRNVTNGTTYWYVISPNHKRWEPTPVYSCAVINAYQSKVDRQRASHLQSAQRARELEWEQRARELDWGVSRGEQVETEPEYGAPTQQADRHNS